MYAAADAAAWGEAQWGARTSTLNTACVRSMSLTASYTAAETIAMVRLAKPTLLGSARITSIMVLIQAMTASP